MRGARGTAPAGHSGGAERGASPPVLAGPAL